jgi:TM2 domain-containing membrane protein YozV
MLVGVGRFCLGVNCTGILVSINQPLRIYVKAIGWGINLSIIDRQITPPESVGAGLCK